MNTYHLHIPFKTRVLNFFRMFFILSGFDQVISMFTKNKPATSLVVKMIPPNYLYSTGTRRRVDYRGISFYADVSDSMDHVVYYGIQDPAQEKLFSLVKPGMNVMDVGTNIGLTALMFAKLVGDEGKVFGFEPDPLNHSKAAKNISLNKFKTLQLFNIGLGDTEGQATIYNVNQGNRGMLRILNKPEASEMFDKTTINLTTIDRFMCKQQLNGIDLVKIDVEGFELNVLKGASGLLSTRHPVLFIELDDNNLMEQNASALELLRYLWSFGYETEHAVTGMAVDESTEFDNCHFDIICTHKAISN